MAQADGAPPKGIRLIYASGECEVDLVYRELVVHGSPVPIGGRAFDFIEVLVRSAGELVTKDELMDRLWPGAVVAENTLQVHAGAVRRALGPYRDLLKTEARRGYRLLGEWTVQLRDTATPPVGLRQMRITDQLAGTNFPASIGPLVGRSAAQETLQTLASAYRVVTLTGPGGIGKTVLALEVARRLVAAFTNGGWLVDLASIADAGLVPSAVASVLGLKLIGGAISAEAVARAIADANLLLVLDNCEHVIDAAAPVAEAIARFCPRASVLATSREVLHIVGERVYRVPPLDVPEAEWEDIERVVRRGAVELFIARATDLDADFRSNPQYLSTIGVICRHLDGIPLAIEFAAARAATLGLEAVASGLRDRFSLLTSGRRTALARHRTLRATLDWSYELLAPHEQRLLRHLAIFPGGFTLEAAETVGVAEGDGAPLADGISSLVAKSLLMADDEGSGRRWRLLETIRAYASEKLVQSGEHLATARRHAEYFRWLIVPRTSEMVPSLTVDDLLRYGRELDNVRAALDWSFSSDGDAAVGVALIAAFAPVWIHLSLVVECRARAEQILEMLRSDLRLTPALERRLLMALGVALSLTLGPIARTREVLAKARQLTVGTDDTEVQLRMLWAQWFMEGLVGEYGAALNVAQQFARLARCQGDDTLPLVGDRLLGTSLFAVGELSEARGHLERMLNRYVAPRSGYHTILFHVGQRCTAHSNLARILALQGYLDQARQQIRLSLDETRDADMVTLLHALRHGALPVALMTGDLAAADTLVATMDDLAARFEGALCKIIAGCWKGKLLIARREFARGTALLRDALDQDERSGWRVVNADFLGDLARGLSGLERFDEAIVTVDRALAQATRSREHWCQAELLRTKGELFLQQRPDHEVLAEDCLRAAGDLARSQGALFWELRAALSVARLRVRRENRAGATEVLQPVYDRFTEGFDTADLLAAKALIDLL